MSLINKFLFKKSRWLIIGLGIAGSFALHGSALAANYPTVSNDIPKAGDFIPQGNNVWVTTALCSNSSCTGAYQLNAPTETVRIYTKQPTGYLHLTNGGDCIQSGSPDAGSSDTDTSQAITKYHLWALSANTAAQPYSNTPWNNRTNDIADFSNQTIQSLGQSCTTFSFKYDVSSFNNNSQVAPYTGYYAMEFEADMVLGSGWNSFKLSIDAGYISYFAGSGDHFAVKANDPGCSSAGCPGNFSFGFGVSCVYKPASLKWFDADIGSANQPGPITSVLKVYKPDGTLAQTVNVPINTSNNASGSLDITQYIQFNYKYEWDWNNVYASNGIQFQLPYDSFNASFDFTNTTCDTGGPNSTPPDASCTANGLVNYKNAGSVSVTYKFTNTGSTTWTPNDNPLKQYRRYVNGTAFSPITVPNNVAPGGSFSITVNETAPATGQKVIKYTMWQSGVGAFGSPCTATLTAVCTSGCCGTTCGGGSISVSCNSINISGVSSLATQSFTTGSPLIIKRVPVVVRLTADDGTTYSWIVNDSGGNYGIPNQSAGGSGSNSFAIHPYQIPGINFTMWPHQSYTVELAIEGIPPSNSATYQDNGWWNPTNNANDGNFYYGIQIVDSETTPTNCLTASCSGTTPVDAEPGQLVRDLKAGIQFNNQTSGTYSANDPNGYQMVLNSDGGLKISNVRYDNIIPGTNVSNVTFDAEVDYTGNYSVSLNFKGQSLDIGEQNPCPSQQVRPKTRAFIEATGGDILAGGGFAQGLACTNKTYPYYVGPATISGNSPYSGGIAAYGNHSTGLGSKAQFGVLSLGYNMGGFSGPIGLFSVDTVGSWTATLSNQTAQNGGLLNQTGTSDWHCAKDYYDLTKKTSPPPSNFSGGAVPGSSLQYTATGPINISASTIAAGQQTTIYVDGDVTITGNITNTTSYDASVRSQIPYFVLIARGNIYVSSGVNRLDGLFIAQPDPTTNYSDGKFATCRPNDLCNEQLIVNGAVLAQEVDLLREHGTQGPLNADPNGICAPTGSSNCPPAEIFNFTPAMLLGQPNLAPTSTGFKSLFSLPPVF